MTKVTRRTLNDRRERPSDPVPDPFKDINYNQSLQETSTQEAEALMSGFRQRAKNEQERFTLATDSEFWFAVGFKSREQKERFLQVMGWIEFGDKFLNGPKIAEKQGIELPEVQLSQNLTKKVDRKLLPLTKRTLKK